MRYGWQRYQRQLGLVYQERLARLRVLVVGDDPALVYTLINLALLGIGTIEHGELLILPCEAHPSVTREALRDQCLLIPADIGAPYEARLAMRLSELNRDVRYRVVTAAEVIGMEPDVVIVFGDEPIWHGLGQQILYARTGKAAIWFGERPECLMRVARGDHACLLTAGLASMLGALLAQEILRRRGLLRPLGIERFWLSANVRLEADAHPPEGMRLGVGGTLISMTPDTQTARAPTPDGLGRVYRALIPFDHDLTRLIWAASALDAPDPAATSAETRSRESFYYSPFTGWRPPLTSADTSLAPDGFSMPPIPQRLREQTFAIGGAGGLGSWLIATLAASPIESSRLLVFESDAAVEEHNLNRQILYRSHQLGVPKGEAIMETLRETARELEVTLDSRHLILRERDRLAPLLRGADVVFTAFDNFAARYVLGMAAAQLGIPVVNGGALVFRGDAQLLRPGEEGCIECLWEAEVGRDQAIRHRTDVYHLSCTREDEFAEQIGSAIVTTNALIGSLQAVLALAALSMPQLEAAAIDHSVKYVGRDNLILRCRIPQISGQPHCTVHRRRAGHLAHMSDFENGVNV